MFKDLLDEIESFKNQITVKVLLKQHKGYGYMEFASVYFTSTTKTVTYSDKYMPDKFFQEIIYRIDNWINEQTGWVLESVDTEYVNLSIFSPSSGSIYTELSHRLKKLNGGSD